MDEEIRKIRLCTAVATTIGFGVIVAVTVALPMTMYQLDDIEQKMRVGMNDFQVQLLFFVWLPSAKAQSIYFMAPEHFALFQDTVTEIEHGISHIVADQQIVRSKRQYGQSVDNDDCGLL